jgi:ADP-heptose:LPS heptosyltransferase
MKICIIKLGAKGDVIRTVPIAEAIRNKYPNAEITWITKPNISDLLQLYSFIDNVITVCPDDFYDLLYNFDIEEKATQLAQSINAEKKLGFYSEDNFPQAFNLGAEYYLNTLFDDETKKSNTKTYQEMMFEAAEIPPTNKNSFLCMPQTAQNYADNFLNQISLSTENLIGVQIGSSPRWPSKAPHPDILRELITKLKSANHQILLLGGPEEMEKLKQLSNELKVPTNNPSNTNIEFASLISKCQKIICPDSFALHLALALNKPTIALFYVTSPNEVEPYNLLKKITSPRLKEFFPEKCDQYDENLVKSIAAEDILRTI